ncbi:O-antigen ligase domain-containing protein [Rhodovarius crocodyli]|uniref:O-antigen ligase domain-containing protein n=1 Tax=Rhodovarius crocodyli TaxID=1979269 RepID=A0A437MM17_9PROT|nr:O-antigen ligase family protein [Rhodovarius crocodyli]RVT98707.1 O-antigen ligase domain-containing protein [Rhodovarius crocodyli]
MIRASGAFAALAGLSAATLHYAGALKTSPLLARAPLDITVLALAALLPLLALMLAGGGWRVGRGIALPVLAAAGLWLWWVLAGAWAPNADTAIAKLAPLVLMGPLMLLAGLLVGADTTARNLLAHGVIGIGLLVAAGLAWGLATDSIQLGGRGPEDIQRVRVQYQLAGLAMASGAILAVLRVVEARSGWGRLAWLAVALPLAGGVFLPGGRAALLVLGAGVALVPAFRLWVARRPGAALGWVALVGLAGVAALGLVALDPERAERLRTLDRLMGDPGSAPEARLQLWSAAWRLAEPLGLGPGAFPQAAGYGVNPGMYPHNHALEAVAEGGFPGMVLWLAAFGGGLVLLLAGAWRLEAGRAARILALVLPMAITVMVSTDLTNRMAWFALGLALSAALERLDV